MWCFVRVLNDSVVVLHSSPEKVHHFQTINLGNNKNNKQIKIARGYMYFTGGLNHLPYLLSISVSMAVIKDFSTNYMKALGLNQAYMLLKLRNIHYIVLIYSIGSTTGNILQLINKRFLHIFFIWIKWVIFAWYWKR